MLPGHVRGRPYCRRHEHGRHRAPRRHHDSADAAAEVRPPSLSPSRASDFMTCPLLYRFRVIDRLPEPPSPAATRGTVVHAVLERLFDLPAAERTPARARALLAPEWERLLEAEPELGRAVRRRRGPRRVAHRRPQGLLDAYFALEDPTAARAGRARAVRRVRPRLRAAAARATSTGSTWRRAATCGSSTTRPAGRPGEGFEAKAMFQMRFYALVLWRLRGEVPAAAAAALPRQRRGAALRARRGRPAGHRAQGRWRCGTRSSGPPSTATGGPARASCATGATTRRSARPSAAPRPSCRSCPCPSCRRPGRRTSARHRTRPATRSDPAPALPPRVPGCFAAQRHRADPGTP